MYAVAALPALARREVGEWGGLGGVGVAVEVVGVWGGPCGFGVVVLVVLVVLV